jgi:DNA-directed RNA polymerase beta' subunit
VDYSARSVIVVGPELKNCSNVVSLKIWQLNYKPFVIRKLIERGIVKTVNQQKNNRQKRACSLGYP